MHVRFLGGAKSPNPRAEASSAPTNYVHDMKPGRISNRLSSVEIYGMIVPESP